MNGQVICNEVVSGGGRCSKPYSHGGPHALETDPVNPAHYQGDYVMRIIEDFELDFLTGTIVKYLLRAGKKAGDSDVQDLRKAQWYLNRKIANLENPDATRRS